mgnify:CR=1 FL=1
MTRQSALRVSLCMLAALIPWDLRADEHPYAHVRVGDYSTYTIRMKVAGFNIDGTATQTITAKRDQEVTVRTTGQIRFMGNSQILPPREQKIDLSKPFDPTAFHPRFPQGAELQVQKLQEGREKITIGDKSYDCTWTEYRIQAKSFGKILNSNVKVWMCRDVPMGMVKMVMKVSQRDQTMETIMELKESGNNR